MLSMTNQSSEMNIKNKVCNIEENLILCTCCVKWAHRQCGACPLSMAVKTEATYVRLV